MNKKIVIATIIIFWLVVGYVGLKMDWSKEEEKEPQNNDSQIEEQDQQIDLENILGWKKGDWWEIQTRQYSAWMAQPEWMPGPKLKYEVKDIKEDQGQKKAEIILSYSDKENQPEIIQEDFTKIIYDLDNFQILEIDAKIYGEDSQFRGSDMQFAPYYSLCKIPEKPGQEGEDALFKPTEGRLKDVLISVKKVSTDNGFQLWNNEILWWVSYEDENTKAEIVNWQS